MFSSSSAVGTDFVTMTEEYPELKEFILSGIKRTGVRLGSGSYGDVEELCWNGTKCAGKRLHESLLQSQSPQIAQKFISECKIIAKIRHPNIVLFLGLCFFSDHEYHRRPVLVMEKLNDNLGNFLENQPNIRLSVKSSILLDISRGLVHLHSQNPPIIHRDLTSRNILLTSSLQAKIADLGTARILGSQRYSRISKQTPVPGTPIFMPPEAFSSSPTYDTKLDVFSFGGVMLHTLTQVSPCDLLSPKYQSGTKTKARSELERRTHYMEILYSSLGKEHQLTKLITNCLADLPKKRPVTRETMQLLEAFHLELENCGKKYDPFSGLSVLIEDADKKPTKIVESVEETDGEWDIVQRKRTATFMETHILRGHRGVLGKYKTGGMLRRNAEWRDHVFKITEGKLQYHDLNDRLQGELVLSKVECVKGFWSPNSPSMFPFHVHFKGKDSPWILSAHSNEERQSWMEVIKPGSTLNQWVQSTIKNTSPVEECPPPVPPRPPRTFSTSLYAPASNLLIEKDSNGVDGKSHLHVLQSQQSDCPYVRANEVLMPPNKEGYVGMENVDAKTLEASPYIQIIAPTANDSLTTLEEGIMKELGEQFDPVQIDLLIQMFRPRQRLSSSSSSSSPNDSLKVSQTNEYDGTACTLSNQHIGYAKEGQTHPYKRLASIALTLNQIKADRDDADTRSDNQEDEGNHNFYCPAADMLLNNESKRTEDIPPEKDNTDPTMSLNHRLIRRNAIRSTYKKARPEVEMSVSEKVSTLRAVLRQASTEAMLEDSAEDRQWWSKASGEAIKKGEIPKAARRISTYVEYDLFLPQESLINIQQIGEGQFGPVYRAHIVTNNVQIPVALKAIKNLVSSKADMNNFLHEMEILKCIRHPNIAQIYGIVHEANQIVMEYLPNGNLKNFLICNKRPASHLLKYMLDISMGMHYLSAKGLVHRKLAARNVLVSESEVCKVADLDLGGSQVEENILNTSPQEGVKDPYKPLRWMAPESILQRLFSDASDVWSYGVVLWEIFNPSKMPYDECDDKVCVDRIVKGFVPDVPKDCPETVKKIMKACWYQTPSSRPSFLYISTLLSNTILEHA